MGSLHLESPTDGGPPRTGRFAPRQGAALAGLTHRGNRTVVDEIPERVAPRKRLENLLTLDVRKYTPLRDPYGYAMIEIKRLNPEVLPILSKDILFVQDSSASITDKRLH